MIISHSDPSLGHHDPATSPGAADRNSDSFSDTLKATSPTPARPTAMLGNTDVEPASENVPPKVPLRKRRWFIIVSIIGNCIGIAFLFIMLFPVVKAIIQDVVNQAAINVSSAAVSNPTNDSFQLYLQGTVVHTSVVSAVISFPTPINVSWVDGSTKVPLGYMQLSTLHTSHQHATLNDTTTFYITNQAGFDHFMSTLVTSQNFTWQLENYDLTVQADKFPTAHGVSFNKLITLNGFNNFEGGVQLGSFQLPSDNPASGMQFATSLQLNNPSPFGVDLGTTVFNLSYEGIYFGYGTGSDYFLSPGDNNLTFNVVFNPQTVPSAITAVAGLISNILNGQTSPVLAVGYSATQPDGAVISWLTQAVQSLRITIPF